MREQDIINHLLDSYENSRHLTRPGASNRRVLWNVLKSKAYDYEDGEKKQAFNAAVFRLTEAGVLFHKFVKGRAPELLEEIWLNLEQLDLAYRLAGRVSILRQAAEFSAVFAEMERALQTAWLKEFCVHERSRLDSCCKLTPLCKKGLAHLAELFKALLQWERLDGSLIQRRTFSILCYRDSKYFQRKIQGDFLEIVSDFCPDFSDLTPDEQYTDSEKLLLLGIQAAEEYFELRGNVTLRMQRGEVDCGLFPTGFVFHAGLLDELRGIELSEIAQVLFIENKACYDQMYRSSQQQRLLIYHGGFSSPRKLRFFQWLSDKIGTQACYFWGDIDLGGFRMFERLRTVIPQLQPWGMSAQEVVRYKSSGLPREETYWEKVEEYRSCCADEFLDSLEAILKYRVTIEQEVFLLDSLET